MEEIPERPQDLNVEKGSVSPPVAEPIRPAPPARRRGVGCWVGGIVLSGGLLSFLLLFMVLSVVRVGRTPAPAREHIALLRWEGIIGSGQAGLLGMGTSVEGFIERLKQAEKRPSARAIVIRLNSPGGSAAASQELYRAILTARQHKPVVVSMGDTAASGGYYIAAAATRIVANPATMTGSIGVIISGYNLAQLFERIGVEPKTITSGPHKDILSFDRPITREEERILREVVDSVYQQFLRDVAEGRGMEVEALRPLADGRVFSGEQAFQKGLVDKLGGLQEAIELAAQLARLPGEPEVVEYQRRSALEQWLGVQVSGRTGGLGEWMGQRLLLLSRVPSLLLMN